MSHRRRFSTAREDGDSEIGERDSRNANVLHVEKRPTWCVSFSKHCKNLKRNASRLGIRGATVVYARRMQLDVFHLRRALAVAIFAIPFAVGSVGAEPLTTAPKSAAQPNPQSSAELEEGKAKEEVKLARRRSRRRRSKARPKPPKAREPEETAEAAAPITTSRGRPSRVEFDERLIRGQTNKADAIYLFERRSSEMRTLVKKRKHFHREINETLD